MQISELRKALLEGAFNDRFKTLYGSHMVRETENRYLAALDEFEKLFPNHNEIQVISTPGRTEIGGNHTDHNAGYVLAASLNVDVISIAARTDDRMMTIKSEGFPQFTVDASDLAVHPEEFLTSAALLRGVAARLSELGYAVGGFVCYTTSNVPDGAGLSSSAAFEVQMCSILNHLYNDGKVDAVTNAMLSQYSENNYFGKPCGLMDQTACAVGGMLKIDFRDFEKPVIEKIDFDFAAQNHALYLVDTGGSHSDLNDDYSALENEMKQVAKALGHPVLRFTSRDAFFENLPSLREACNDRAILRAYHYYNENDLVLAQTKALQKNNFEHFKDLIIRSGRSSFMYCQDVYTNHHWQEQGLSVALMIAEDLLEGTGAWRMHGGGFAGTIQAFVPNDLADEFEKRENAVFGKNAAHRMMIRPEGTVRIA